MKNTKIPILNNSLFQLDYKLPEITWIDNSKPELPFFTDQSFISGAIQRHNSKKKEEKDALNTKAYRVDKTKSR